jgi:hypothetical protein
MSLAVPYPPSSLSFPPIRGSKSGCFKLEPALKIRVPTHQARFDEDARAMIVIFVLDLHNYSVVNFESMPIVVK